MEYKKLKYVLTVAEVRSISKAASILYISQPSLSNIISKLEIELGIKIFDRTTTPISLTYAGESFIEIAKEILRMNDKLKKEFNDIRGMQKGRIRIGIPPIRGSFMLPHVLPDLHKKYPGIEVVLLERNSDQLEENLISGKIDMIFTVVPSLDTRIVHEVIGKEKIKLVCKKGFLSTKYIMEGTNNVVDFSKLDDLDFILTKRGHRIREYIEKIFEENGIKPRILMETSNSGTAYRLATAGMGVSFASEVTINSTKAMTEYDLFDIDNPSFQWEIGVLYRNGAYITLAERFLIDKMKEVLMNI